MELRGREIDLKLAQKDKELEFQRDEKEKDRLESKSRDKINLAIACVNSGRSYDEIEKISQLL